MSDFLEEGVETLALLSSRNFIIYIEQKVAYYAALLDSYDFLVAAGRMPLPYYLVILYLNLVVCKKSR